MMKKKEKEKVLVAMSGGVDSSVAAAILLEEGFDVVGATMKLFCYSDTLEADPGKTCCSVEAAESAMKVADRLDIEHVILDMEDIFREEVLKRFFREYSRGRTPNPCITCNSRVKFHHLHREGLKIGARYLATGHFARVGRSEEETGAGDVFSLSRAIDTAKDQSYFLWEMNQDILSRTLFPLGELRKEHVREIARSLGLDVADRPESQDFCYFSMDGAGKAARPSVSEDSSGLGLSPDALKPGPIIDTRGRRIGTHRGIARYTTGQRRGLGVALGKPVYVVRILPDENTIVIGNENDLLVDEFPVTDVNWISGEAPQEPISSMVKVRSRSRPIPARVIPTGKKTADVRLEMPKEAVTPGQSAVWYDGDVVVGGGIIDSHR